MAAFAVIGLLKPQGLHIELLEKVVDAALHVVAEQGAAAGSGGCGGEASACSNRAMQRSRVCNSCPRQASSKWRQRFWVTSRERLAMAPRSCNPGWPKASDSTSLGCSRGSNGRGDRSAPPQGDRPAAGEGPARPVPNPDLRPDRSPPTARGPGGPLRSQRSWPKANGGRARQNPVARPAVAGDAPRPDGGDSAGKAAGWPLRPVP